MSIGAAFFYVLLGLLVVLLPVGVIGLSASRLSPAQRIAAMALYGAAVLLLVIIAFDLTEPLANRAAVDLVLLAGGIGLGFAAGRLWRILRPHQEEPPP
jgi:hypothetical protein